MLTQWNHLYLARICLQTLTPLSIQTGQAQQNFDTSLVRDANGLPTLPSTSIRGVLRHLFQAQFGEQQTHQLFGYARTNQAEPEDQTSRIQISWGLIHDKHNRPVEGLVYPSEDADFLDQLTQSQPIKRERVRLNHKGCAEDKGKFDITACPAGARFTFELKYWSDTDQDDCWRQLLDLLQQPQFRLGHSTRSGFGAFEVQAMEQHQFDFTSLESVARWQKLARSLTITQPEAGQINTAKHSITHKTISLNLKAEGFVRIGGGDVPMHETSDPADLRMQSESVIQWVNDQGRFSKRRPLISASAIKGALAHRMLYHCNRLNGKFADQLNQSEWEKHTQRQVSNELVKLLGAANNDNDTDTHNDGQAGHLYLNDLYLSDEVSTTQLWHNRIDRFTGGVIDGALFTEEVLFEPELAFDLTITNFAGLSPNARQALKATLDDLCSGRLALGAGGSRGLGSFTGTHSLSDQPVTAIAGEC